MYRIALQKAFLYASVALGDTFPSPLGSGLIPALSPGSSLKSETLFSRVSSTLRSLSASSIFLDSSSKSASIFSNFSLCSAESSPFSFASSYNFLCASTILARSSFHLLILFLISPFLLNLSPSFLLLSVSSSLESRCQAYHHPMTSDYLTNYALIAMQHPFQGTQETQQERHHIASTP